ncbi:MAG TPA: hypothetical protein PKN86_22240, partial [Candidatus Obscuribacter sp.]|nr:hypothetical protein [Candidatus Obscuribacter sp.]
ASTAARVNSFSRWKMGSSAKCVFLLTEMHTLIIVSTGLLVLAVFLLFCLAEILALLLFCSRDNSPSKGEKELLERLQKRD